MPILATRMSSESDLDVCTPPDVVEKANIATEKLLPEKSRERYNFAYSKFMNWRTNHNIKSFSENVMLAYFEELSATMKASSLWTIYSMLRTTINIYNNTNISTYCKLISFIKRKSDGYKPKKSKTLTPPQINNFLKNAPDSQYLFMKVNILFPFK